MVVCRTWVNKWGTAQSIFSDIFKVLIIRLNLGQGKLSVSKESQDLLAFEASFGVNTEKEQMLAWYGRKPEWTKLRKEVVELYQADMQCFEKYKVWRLTTYVKGAVSLKDVLEPTCTGRVY